MALFKRAPKTFSEADVEKAVKDALDQQAFDFSQLWVEPEGSGGLLRLVPMINMVLLIITIAIVAFK